jgi:hypothetical protein
LGADIKHLEAQFLHPPFPSEPYYLRGKSFFLFL